MEQCPKYSARYFKDNNRMVIEHKFQRMPEKVVAWSDTDHAGCKRARSSTSGGVVMLGGHCAKTHSQTQETIGVGHEKFAG